jgi:hypothetical protein
LAFVVDSYDVRRVISGPQKVVGHSERQGAIFTSITSYKTSTFPDEKGRTE